MKRNDMDFNTVLRSLRYALDYSDQQMADIFALGGQELSATDVADLLKREEQDGFKILEEKEMTQFLDGLITKKRGPAKPGTQAAPKDPLDNNMILKKLRIAMELKEEGMIKTLEKGGFVISKAELSALFRKKGHKHYRVCGDQVLRHFLKGLSQPD